MNNKTHTKTLNHRIPKQNTTHNPNKITLKTTLRGGGVPNGIIVLIFWESMVKSSRKGLSMNAAHIGHWVRDARKKQGLTQEQLAALCGVGTRFLRELEHGKETCQIGKALWVMQALGLDVHVTERGTPR
jgi:y4mF family transcriptional regulator